MATNFSGARQVSKPATPDFSIARKNPNNKHYGRSSGRDNCSSLRMPWNEAACFKRLLPRPSSQLTKAKGANDDKVRCSSHYIRSAAGSDSDPCTCPSWKPYLVATATHQTTSHRSRLANANGRRSGSHSVATATHQTTSHRGKQRGWSSPWNVVAV